MHQIPTSKFYCPYTHNSKDIFRLRTVEAEAINNPEDILNKQYALSTKEDSVTRVEIADLFIKAVEP